VTEIADTDRAIFSSIAIDSSGKAHISYYGLGGLKYATNAPGLWVSEIVDSNGMHSSIAVDSSDNVYISYSYDNYLKLATNASGSWAIETVDSNGWVSENTSIAVDSSDSVHISYGDSSSGYPNYLFNLKYATNASGSWVIEIVDSNGWVGENTSIAVDFSGGVHISYGDYTNYPYFYPKYATNASGSWVTEIVDDSGVLQSISKTSIAVDSSDNVHIGYVYERYFPSSASPKFYLKYSSNSSGSWVTETVDSGGKAGRYASVAIDSTDNVHISYVTDQGLMHKTNASGSWVAEIVDSGGSWSNSIATDSRDNVHISYSYCYSYNRNCELKYATNASVSWVTEIVDDDECFSSNSIVVDSSDKVHIRYLSYYEDKAYPNYYLKYATNASGSWVTETVLVGAAREDSGNSIAIDSAGKVHIAYRDAYWLEFPSTVNHVTNASGSWVTEIVDSRGGLSPSIAIDSTDKVHISYYYPIYYTNFRDLKYTTNTSGSWVTEIVDNGEGLISYPSIAIDSTDNVHISYAYYDYPYSNLKYATNASGSWVTETVDSDGGGASFMAMDSTDHVYIVYYDTVHYDLKYATNKPLPEISVTDSVDPADDLLIPFGEVRGNRPLRQTATVTNIADSGSEKLVISAVYLTGADPEQFDVRKDDCSNRAIAPSESCTIDIVFSPQEAGVYSARLGIDSNDFDTPELYVELTGTGVTKRKQGRNNR